MFKVSIVNKCLVEMPEKMLRYFFSEKEDLTIGVIHSRKINIRAVLVLHAVSEMPEVFEITDGMQESVACMQQKQDVEISELVLEKRDLCRQKNEMILPSSKPNIREILWKSIELRNVGSRPEGARLHLNGEVQVSILYQEEEEPDRIQWYETTLPLECSVELGEENIFSDRNVFYKLQIEEVIKAHREYASINSEEARKNLIMECADIQMCVETLMYQLGTRHGERTRARRLVWEKNNERDYFKKKRKE